MKYKCIGNSISSYYFNWFFQDFYHIIALPTKNPYHQASCIFEMIFLPNSVVNHFFRMAKIIKRYFVLLFTNKINIKTSLGLLNSPKYLNSQALFFSISQLFSEGSENHTKKVNICV